MSKYDPDALRYYLTATAPETHDTEFSWQDFVERNNNELVVTWGNLANRMLSFACKDLTTRCPSRADWPTRIASNWPKFEVGFETMGVLYNACKFRAALGEAMALAREANGYLARKAHWFQRDRQRNARLRAGANHPVSFSSRGLVPHAADESAHKGCL